MMPRTTRCPRKLHPGQRERGHRVHDDAEHDGDHGDHDRVHHELRERDPVEDPDVVVQVEMSPDRQERVEAAEVVEDLQVGLEAATRT